MLLSLASVGQTRHPLTLYQILQQDGIPLHDKFTSLVNLSHTDEEDGAFKRVRWSNLNTLRKQVQDSVMHYQKEIASLRELTSSASGTIAGLRDSIAGLDAQLQSEKQHASDALFGLALPFGAYHAVVWLIIVVLAAIYTTSYASFKRAKVDAMEHKNTADELQEELRVLRKKSMEKEQQLKRQLLDEQAKKS